MNDMWKSLKVLGITKFLNLMSMVLMLLSLLCGYAKVMASNDAQDSARRTAQIVEMKVRSPVLKAAGTPASLSITPANRPLYSRAQASASAVNVPSTAVPVNSAVSNYQTFKLQDEKGNPVRPSGIVQSGDSIFLLGDDCLWLLPGVVGTTKEPKPLTLKKLPVPGNKIKGIPIQEFLAACYFQPNRSVVVLDKSGSLFEYFPDRGAWGLMRANKQTLGTPDPHYVSLTSDGLRILLLDPERNQIWRYPAARIDERYFREVLPWRIKAGDPNVADGVAIGYDGSTLVLRRSGNISIYPSGSHGGNGSPRKLNYKAPRLMSPSRMAVSSQGGPIYVIERENNRILAVDKKTGNVSQFLFPAGSDLRSLLPGNGGFCVIDGDGLVFRMLKDADSPNTPVQSRLIDSRLKVLHIPIRGASLPRHPGVFPGARRLYRHGVHQGLDFFYDSGSGASVYVDTPAVAAAAGKVIRADVNYRDMTPAEYSRIMSDCARQQYCSEANEDLFRGCQVWVDHGAGLVTKYAHLNKARSDLRVGMSVAAGETVGFIGYSGTGENVPGRVKHPHLHFEIHLDGHYVGHGLTPSETIAMYQKIFPSGASSSNRPSAHRRAARKQYKHTQIETKRMDLPPNSAE